MKEEVFYFHSGLIKVRGKKKPFRATAAGVVDHRDGLAVLHIGVAECAPDDTFVKSVGRTKAYWRAKASGDRHNQLKMLGMVANILLSDATASPRKLFNDRAIEIFNKLGKVYWFKTHLKHKTYEEVQLEEQVENNKIIQFARAEKEKIKHGHFAAAKMLEEHNIKLDKEAAYGRAADDGPLPAEFDPDEFKEDEKNVLLNMDPSTNHTHSPEY